MINRANYICRTRGQEREREGESERESESEKDRQAGRVRESDRVRDPQRETGERDARGSIILNASTVFQPTLPAPLYSVCRIPFAALFLWKTRSRRRQRPRPHLQHRRSHPGAAAAILPEQNMPCTNKPCRIWRRIAIFFKKSLVLWTVCSTHQSCEI